MVTWRLDSSHLLNTYEGPYSSLAWLAPWSTRHPELSARAQHCHTWAAVCQPLASVPRMSPEVCNNIAIHLRATNSA